MCGVSGIISLDGSPIQSLEKTLNDSDLEKINNFGCSLVYGHPNAPTGMRGAIELIGELVLNGGGLGLFTGCAAGDTAMSLILKVNM